MCPIGSRCPFKDCNHLHPERPEPFPCVHGDRSSRAKPAFDEKDGSSFSIDPFMLRFTQAKISAQFQDGSDVDMTIDHIRGGSIEFSAFEPLDVVKIDREVLQDANVVEAISEGPEQAAGLIDGLRATADSLLCLSNRRLFVARVARRFGKLQEVRVRQLSLDAARFQRADIRFANWVRDWAARDPGSSVNSKSSYKGFDRCDSFVQSVNLPLGIGVELAIVAKDAICRRLRGASQFPNIACRVHKDRSGPLAIDTCSPKKLLVISQFAERFRSLESLRAWLEEQQEVDEIESSQQWLHDATRRASVDWLAKSEMREDWTKKPTLLWSTSTPSHNAQAKV